MSPSLFSVKRTVLVVCAGTSDLPVAEEAAVTAETMGNRVERVNDVGVAGALTLEGFRVSGLRLNVHLEDVRLRDVVAPAELFLPQLLRWLPRSRARHPLPDAAALK